MAADLFTEADISLALPGGAETLRRFAGDTGVADATPDAARIAYGISVASEQIYGLLLAGGWSVAQVIALAAADPAVRHAGVMIWREVLCEGRDEFRLPDGSSMFSVDGRRARDTLRSKASSSTRTSAQEAAGVGPSALASPRSSNLATPAVMRTREGRPIGF